MGSQKFTDTSSHSYIFKFNDIIKKSSWDCKHEHVLQFCPRFFYHILALVALALVCALLSNFGKSSNIQNYYFCNKQIKLVVDTCTKTTLKNGKIFDPDYSLSSMLPRWNIPGNEVLLTHQFAEYLCVFFSNTNSQDGVLIDPVLHLKPHLWILHLYWLSVFSVFLQPEWTWSPNSTTSRS